MKSVSTDSNRVVSFGEKVSYGITEIACNPMYTIFCSFLVFFYNLMQNKENSDLQRVNRII